MTVQFQETLRGNWFPAERPDEARLCEVVLSIRASREGDRARVVHGELTGTATFDGLATVAAVAGELHLEPGRPRRVTYAFGFEAADGRRLQFAGAKQIRVLRPIASATTLTGEIRDQERAIATVRLKFDVRRDFVVFLQSLSRRKGD